MDDMDLGRRWSDLDERTRRLLIGGSVVDKVFVIAALYDLRHRAAHEVRGRRWVWATVLTVANSLGVVPLAYFVVGRRRP
jgi:hypothetical protein